MIGTAIGYQNGKASLFIGLVASDMSALADHDGVIHLHGKDLEAMGITGNLASLTICYRPTEKAAHEMIGELTEIPAEEWQAVREEARVRPASPFPRQSSGEGGAS